MIRSVGKNITINKYVAVQELITQERITEIHTWPDTKNISVTIGLLNSNMELVKIEEISIDNSNYDLLFSDNEIFLEGKQEGSYRESDMWKVIDLIR